MQKDGMNTGDYIRSVKFDYAMRGYKVADVEMFLDEVADDFDKLVAQNRALSERLSSLMKEQENIEEKEKTEKIEQPAQEIQPIQPAPEVPKVNNSGNIEQVQSILVTAQRFSDQIINEANEKAASILFEANTKAKEIDEKVASVMDAFEKDVAERKAKADSEISKMLGDAAAKAEGIITAAHDSVARQQLLFDKIKVEASEFKKQLFDNHKQQLEVLQKIPDCVPYDPEHAAKALEFEVNAEPNFRSFLPNIPSVEIAGQSVTTDSIAEPIADEIKTDSELSDISSVSLDDAEATV